MKIGIAGMGIAIGLRRIEQGDERVVWNLMPARAKPLIDAVHCRKDALLSGDVAGKTSQVRL